MIEAGAAGILQPSVTKVGGLTAMLEVAELAQGVGLLVVPQCPNFALGLLASLHFPAAMAAAEPLEIYFAELEEAPFGRHFVPKILKSLCHKVQGLVWSQFGEI